MKLKFQKLKAESRKLKSVANSPLQSVAEAGIALVVTLIMVSVIAFMAITFLVISQRERGSVSVTSSQTDARLAAETALQTATAKLLAPVIAFTNPFNYDLLISTNYINPAGFFTGNNYPTNVNYDYLSGGGALTINDTLQNIANLLYDPRPPVFITNRVAGSNDFRYYLDLNRNGHYDTNGLLPVIADNLGNTNGLTNLFVGDPEWIGILERPEQPHSSSNKFIARYAYVAVPVSKTLDLNYIHNYAKRRDANMAASQQDGFMRNQGVGTWENNLGAFLADLNTNYWNYNNNYLFNTNLLQPNQGSGFDDALSLLRYRYNGSENSLATVAAQFPNNRFVFDNIDEYADGPLMAGGNGIDESLVGNQDVVVQSWPGSDNINHFFSTQDLFDTNKTAIGLASVASNLTTRLEDSGTRISSYDRYTYYRLLSQLGTDSTAESGKINLNYRNVDTNTGAVVPNMETNFYAWTPIEFFTNVADRLLLNLTNEAEYKQAFGNRQMRITNIVIWPTNNYTPAVHRTLQVAANLYDATTNRYSFANNLAAPSVFRPLFRRSASGNILIAGYREVVNADMAYNATAPTYVDLAQTNTHSTIPAVGTAFDPVEKNEPMVYGFPLVIGAKKGFPGFNALALQTEVKATRKLELYRRSITNTPYEIRQMYLLGVSNVISVAAWNSYTNKYPRSVDIIGATDVTTVMTNENGIIPTLYGSGLASNRWFVPCLTNIAAGKWTGLNLGSPKYSFQFPLSNSFAVLTNATWQSASVASSLGYFIPSNSIFNQQGLTPPHWKMNVSTRLRFIMVDTATSRILDYVNLSSDADTLDITHVLNPNEGCNTPDASPEGVWCTNKPATYPSYTYVPTYGILNQIGISQGSIDVSDTYWKYYNSDVKDKATAIRNFSAFMSANPSDTNLVMQTPFNPFRQVYQYVSWQANDPLVHYMIQDLTDLIGGMTNTIEIPNNNLPPKESPITRMGSINPVSKHYQPWGGNPYSSETTPATAYHLELKDPLVKQSDHWDFPTNTLPSLGWLGRVHRGTPWQTIYMKSTTVDTNTWKKWTGNTDNYDSILAQPDKDWHMFDLFTTAPNANATRGQLPINQTNLAAWSAVLSGVVVLQNTSSNSSVAIEPAGVNTNLQYIVEGINNWRTNAGFNGIGGSFTNLGGILAVPELTVKSPYLSSTNLTSATNINDTVLERIPQQIMSLLRLGDEQRFVIYAYGQSLKPADRSIVSLTGYTGLCTNYQITGESAVRAVVRVKGAGVHDAQPYRPQVIIESYNNLPPD